MTDDPDKTLPTEPEGKLETAQTRLAPSMADDMPHDDMSQETLIIESSSDDHSGSVGAVSQEDSERYVFLDELGRGGLGRVYVARDRHVERDVAVKELLPEAVEAAVSAEQFLAKTGAGDRSEDTVPDTLSDQSRLTPGKRFLREARLTGQLEHPSIMPVYEIGQRTNGQLYYTMRRIRGRTLANALADVGDDQRQRLLLLPHLRDLCQAMAYAHSRGVIHRDIKPDNVMIGEFGETVVLDWGLAKVLGEPDTSGARLEANLEQLSHADGVQTMAGHAMGTPSYMPPEQARGELDQVDHVSYVYSLGAVLYELLAGRPPYDGTNALKVLTQVVRGAPVPLREAAPAAPAELAAIAQKAIARKREERYPNAADLVNELDAYMSGDRVAAHDYSSWEVFRRFVARHRLAFAVAATVALALVVTSVVTSLSYRRERQARQREATARSHEAQQRRRAVALSDKLQTAVVKQQRARRKALHHLAQAYAEKAQAMERDQQYVTARIFAAASLVSNPAYTRSPHYSADFRTQHPDALTLKAQAASVIYRGRHYPSLRLVRTLRLKQGRQFQRMGPGATWAASPHKDGTVQLWSIRTGLRGPRLRGHKKPARHVSFAPDEERVVTSSGDSTVRLWQVSTGKELRLWSLPGGASPNHVTWSPDGKTIAVGDRKGGCHLLRAADGRPYARLATPGTTIFQLAWSPDSKRLAVVYWNKSVRIWRAEVPGGHAAPRFTTLPPPPRGWHTATFSRDGKLLLTADWGKTITLFDTRSWKSVRTLRGHQETVYGMGLSPDSKLLISGGLDRQLVIWELAAGRRLAAIQAHDERVRQLTFLRGIRGHRRFATMGWDGTIKVWQWQDGQPPREGRGHRDRVVNVAVAPDSALFATSGWENDVRIWSTRTGTTQRLLKGHKKRLSRMDFSPDGNRLATISWDRTLRLWAVGSGKPLRVLTGHTDRPLAVTFSPDGKQLASTDRAGTVRLWDAATGAPQRHWKAHPRFTWSAAYSPDGGTLATVGFENDVKLWDPRTGKLLDALKGHTDWVTGLSFSADGRWLLTSSKDTQVLLWDLKTRRIHARLKGHKLWVNYVHFFAHGRLAATCSDDHTVRIWAVPSGEPLLVIPTHHIVEALATTPDGRHLIIGDGSALQIHSMAGVDKNPDPTALLRRAEQSAGLKLRGFVIETAR